MSTAVRFARRAVAYGVLAALVGFASSARAAAPSLGSITPYGARRGAEVEVYFSGARLSDAQEILFYYPGITCASLEVVSDNQVKTRLAIAPDCRLGNHAMRVRTASGISELRTFSVGALPEAAEVEPNNDFAQPQKIDLDCTVTGIADNEDVDYYLVEAKKGERITAEVEGIRLGITFFDPYVSIMDMGRFELAGSDDSALLWQDAVASVVAPEDGTYVVQVRESSFAGNGACVYRMHVGRFPRPTATVPAGGRLGQTVDVRWLGDVAGEAAQQVTLPGAAVSNFGLFAQDALGIAPSPNAFRLGDLDNTIEAEPNNAIAEATPFEAPRALNGVVGAATDVDFFRFPAKAGQAFDIRVYARGIRSPLDSVLVVYNADGGGLTSNDDSAGPDSYVRFSAPADGDYLVSVTDHLGKGGADYAYRIELVPVAPTLTMGLPERQQYVDTTVSVPVGNRTAFLVSAGRADWGGELNVDIQGLPPGVTLETVAMPGNQTIVPVLLTAAPDAPMAGALPDVIGRPVDPNLGQVVGHLVQEIGLVRGQNNILVWGHKTERMALAVTEEAPFKIDIVQPNVPLVRGGSMNLKVVATRKEGFTSPIAIQMLYNPPGVGSGYSNVIPEGQNEVAIPLNADGGAEVKTWKIAVMGTATVGNGPILVSSQLANLEVAEPYLSFAFNAAAVEQGKATELVINVTKNKEFAGPATVQLVGLPNEVTTEQREITQDTTELIFNIATTMNSPEGRHQTLLCLAVVTANGEPIAHTLGTGELRIDAPLPPKVDAPPMPEPTPMPEAVAEAPPMKRLTRLEQLRLEREQAKQQAGGGAAAPAAEGAAPATP